MRSVLIFVFCLFFFTGFSQGKLDFVSVRHDFGDLEEMDGPAEHTFSFINIGDEPIKINSVKASCGCTTSGWSQEEILPGDSGFVKAKYNPRNRPGRFSKSLQITSSVASENKTLFITGFVRPKPKSPEDEYPVVLGNLRTKYRSLNVGKITTEKLVEKLFDIYNSSDTVVQLNPDEMTIPAHISVALVPSFLNPKEAGKLRITYDPKAKNDYGYVSDAIALGTNEEAGLSIITTIEEYFPTMTADELDNAPKLSIANITHDFGVARSGDVVEVEIMLENVGKEKLIFRAIKANCGCISYEVKSNNLKKGKSQTLKLFFDTTEMRGNQYKTINVFSNDPVSPTQIITLKGKVVK